MGFIYPETHEGPRGEETWAEGRQSMGRHTLGRYKQVSRDWVSAVLFWFYTNEIMLFCFSHFPFFTS